MKDEFSLTYELAAIDDCLSQFSKAVTQRTPKWNRLPSGFVCFGEATRIADRQDLFSSLLIDVIPSRQISLCWQDAWQYHWLDDARTDQLGVALQRFLRSGRNQPAFVYLSHTSASWGGTLRDFGFTPVDGMSRTLKSVKLVDGHLRMRASDFRTRIELDGLPMVGSPRDNSHSTLRLLKVHQLRAMKTGRSNRLLQHNCHLGVAYADAHLHRKTLQIGLTPSLATQVAEQQLATIRQWRSVGLSAGIIEDDTAGQPMVTQLQFPLSSDGTSLGQLEGITIDRLAFSLMLLADTQLWSAVRNSIE